MGECSVAGCGGDESLARACTYCGEAICMHHHLPENHGCGALTVSESAGAVTRELGSEGSSASLYDQLEAQSASATPADARAGAAPRADAASGQRDAKTDGGRPEPRSRVGRALSRLKAALSR